MLVKTTPVPPRGWNSYDSYGVYINEEQAIANIDAFAEKLAPHGYEYFVLDACWYMDGTFMDTYNLRKENRDRKSHIDQYGRFIESPELFPRGLRFLADRCHNKGIKFGVHLMRGLPARAVAEDTPVKGCPGATAKSIADMDNLCAWPTFYMGAGINMDARGAQEYYDSVVEYLANDVTVDFIKFDDAQEAIREVEALAAAIAKVERPIVLSISPGQETRPKNWARLAACSNMVRITCDIWDGDYAHWAVKFDRWEMFEKLGNENCWIDLDMIPLGGIQVHVPEGTPVECQPVLGCRRKANYSQSEKRTLMTQLALSCSPLFYGGDLPMSDADDIAYATNPDVLACNAQGEGAECIWRWEHLDIRRSYCRGSREHGWIGLFNRNMLNDREFIVKPEMMFEAGVFSAEMFDVWENKVLQVKNNILRVKIPKNGAVFIRF